MGAPYRFLGALACFGALALLAALTLEGTLRLFVWIVLSGLALKTWLHARQFR